MTISTLIYEDLPPWPRYENDLSFRRWIDMSERAPEYTLAWYYRSIRQQAEPSQPVAASA